MTVERLSDAPRKPRPQRSHEEIYDLLAVNSRKSDDAVHRADMLTEVVQRVEKKLDDLLKSVGSESEDHRGEKIGTGVVGKVMRLEAAVAKRFGQYDGWVKIVVGFTACAAMLLPALWWLTGGRISGLLR